jgi:hypothetical protein
MPIAWEQSVLWWVYEPSRFGGVGMGHAVRFRPSCVRWSCCLRVVGQGPSYENPIV